MVMIMAYVFLKNAVYKPAGYFVFGMIVGATLGFLVMSPLNGVRIQSSYLRINKSNSETVNHTIKPLQHLVAEKSLSEKLYDEVRVLCWILTGPQNHESRAKHVKATWGKRCNILLFMSTKEDPSLPSIGLPNLIEDRANLWGKTKEAFKHIYHHYFDKADWFFKADDDTYAIMENMRHMLQYENSSEPIYFGYKFKPLVNQGFMSGGAGYVLSKEAVKRFVNDSIPYAYKCRKENTGNEDVEIGKCLEAVGVKAGDSRDEVGKSRFLPVSAFSLLMPGEIKDNHWIWNYNYYPLKKKNAVYKPARSRYFLFGMIIGATVGFLVMSPLHRVTIQSSYLRMNNSNSKTGDHTIKPLQHLVVEKSVSEKLYDKVRVLCWILTGPHNHESRAKHVKATWGKRCNILLFMSTKDDPSLPSIGLPNLIEDRANLWGKTKEAFKHIYHHYFDKADWFFKADDDTYAIMENMRHMLQYKNSSEPIYFGYRFKPLVNQGYMSGGAGYVLSKEAVKRFVNDSMPYADKCKQENTGNEDVEIGKCLEAVGVKAGDSRDEVGKSRFLPVSAFPLLMPGEIHDDHWLWRYNYYPLKKGVECCSDYIITVHYVDPRTMYLMDYLIYHVKPFGLPENTALHMSSKINDISNQTSRLTRT